MRLFDLGVSHMGGAMSVYGWLVMGLIAFLVVWLVWSFTVDARPRGRALEMLDERYARGEIDRDAYLERKRDIAR